MKKEEPEQNPNAERNADEVILSKKEYEELQTRLKELEGMKEQLLRSAADFENAKKRLVRERDEFVKFSQENLIRNLLPILDNFERALSHTGETTGSNLKAVVTGVQMILKHLNEVMKSQGLTRIETLGKKFDPHLHETVGYVKEKGKEDEIVEEVEPGYQLHDRLLRAAKVKIRVSPSSSVHASEEKQEEIT